MLLASWQSINEQIDKQILTYCYPVLPFHIPPPKASENHRFSDAFRVQGHKREHWVEMNYDQANIKQMINTIIGYQFNLQCHCFHLSLLWVFSILLLYWSHQFFWKKKDFLLIKFFNLNFRFSIGSAKATFVVYFHWWLHEKVQYFCTSSC